MTEATQKADRFGHAPLRLNAIELRARKSLDKGEIDNAQATARSGLRRPVNIEPWINNWKLHWIIAQANDQEAGEHREQASTLLGELIAATPEDLQSGLVSLSETAMLDVAQP